MENKVEYLKGIARQLRIDIIDECYYNGKDRKAHPGPALSCTDIVACLFFDKMNLYPGDWKNSDRDRFILSKGHAAPILYAALAEKGAFDKETLKTLRRFGSILKGHPDMKKIPGVDMTAGSLGHGLAAGLGMALAAKIDKRDYHTYVILGDGESEEGLVWEAAMYAGAKNINNLTAIVDRNGFQSCGKVQDICDLEPLKDKWEAFGWNVLVIDGHNIQQILDAIDTAKATKNKPTAIIAKTTKGKGVSYMENNNSWHQNGITKEQYDIAMAELGE